jgi:hypothetical protein
VSIFAVGGIRRGLMALDVLSCDKDLFANNHPLPNSNELTMRKIICSDQKR